MNLIGRNQELLSKQERTILVLYQASNSKVFTREIFIINFFPMGSMLKDKIGMEEPDTYCQHVTDLWLARLFSLDRRGELDFWGRGAVECFVGGKRP